MAAGNTLLIFGAMDNEPPSSNYATLDSRNGHPVLDFDSTADESAVFTGVMPRNYAGGGLTVYLHYSMSGVTSGDVCFDVAFERIGDGQQDVDSDGFATEQTTGAITVPATDGHVDITSVAFTNGAQMDSIAVGELFRLKITRDVSEDSAAADCELHAIEIRETP